MHKCANDKYIVEGNKMWTWFGHKYRSFNIIMCPVCNEPLQPERSKREDFDKYFGMKAEFKQDGLCYFEDGHVIDPNQPIEDAVL